MTDTPELQGVTYPSEDAPEVEAPAERKQPRKAVSLAAVALITLILVVLLVLFVPITVSRFLPAHHSSRPTEVASAPAGKELLPAVTVLWGMLDLDATPADVAQDLKAGKYYYDYHVPGNFGMAISYWKQALAHPDSANREVVQDLVASAELELARQFSSDSGDVVVLLKQHRRDQAATLLLRMRADFPDIAAPQYVWASVMLSRRCR